jgi:hypothetical protein
VLKARGSCIGYLPRAVAHATRMSPERHSLVFTGISQEGKMSRYDDEFAAIEHNFPVAWTFVSMLLAGCLGSAMLSLLTFG